MAATDFTWGFIILAGLAGLVIAAFSVLLINRTTRYPTLVVSGVIALLILVFFSYWSRKVVRDFGGVPSVVRLSSSSVSPARTSSDFGATQLAIDKTTTAPRIELEKSGEPAPAAAATAEAPVVPRPLWVDQPPQLHGDVYRLPVKSGLFVTKRECERSLDAKLVTAVKDYVDELIEAGASKRIVIEPAMIKALRKANFDETATASVGPMQQVHALLEFDDAARAQFIAHYQAAMGSERLVRVGLGFGMVLSLLAVAFAYLKVDILTSGQYRGRLRMAALAAILLVATCVLVA